MTRLHARLKRIEWQTNGHYPPLVFLVSLLLLALYLIDAISGGAHIAERLAMAPELVWAGQVWRLLSTGLVHGHPLDLAINLALFGFFAHHLHSRQGAWRFLLTMSSTLCLGYLVQALLWPHPGYGFGPVTRLCFMAFVATAPNARMILVPAWLAAVFFVIIDASGLWGQPSSASWLANCVGSFVGWSIIRWPVLYRWARWFQRFSDRLTAGMQRRAAAHDAQDEATIDALLEKVSKDGLPALSESERRFLQRYNERKKARRES